MPNGRTIFHFLWARVTCQKRLEIAGTSIKLRRVEPKLRLAERNIFSVWIFQKMLDEKCKPRYLYWLIYCKGVPLMCSVGLACKGERDKCSIHARLLMLRTIFSLSIPVRLQTRRKTKRD